MRRWPWVAGGVAAVLAVVVVAAFGMQDASASAQNPAAPAACPAAPAAPPGYSGQFASRFRLVPFTPDHALLCRYSGLNASHGAPPGALISDGRVNGADAAKLAASVNAAVSRTPAGPVSCPMDDASSLDAYFWSASQRIRVAFKTNGCQTAANGGLSNAWVARSDIVATLEKLTSHSDAR